MRKWKQTLREKTCWAFAIANYFQHFLGGEVSPYSIIINYFRFKGLSPLNRAYSIKDIFPSLKSYGVRYNRKQRYYPNTEVRYSRNQRYYPKTLTSYPTPVFPCLAIKNGSHWVVMLEEVDKNTYKIIDSLSSSEHRIVKNHSFSDFYQIK